MNLHQWAIKWGVPYGAIVDLQQQMGTLDDRRIEPTDADIVSETAVQSRVRLEASKQGARLWRNNSGAGYMADGSFVRWGLANDSKQMNERIKSSDLIGLRPVRVTPDMVGRTIGQFVARECKPGNWRFTATARETAQLKFIELVLSLGGDAGFTTGS